MSDSHVRRWRALVTPQGLRMEEPGKWAGFLSKLSGKRVYVTVQPEKQVRSLSQNSYLWVIYEAIAEWSGHEAEEIHEAMKMLFLPKRDLAMPDDLRQTIHIVGSTTTLDIEQFSAYVSKVKRWAAESGCYIPDIGELQTR